MQTQDLVARGYRSGRLVQVQRPGLPDADQPDIAKSDGGGQKTGGGEVEWFWFPIQAKIGLE